MSPPAGWLRSDIEADRKTRRQWEKGKIWIETSFAHGLTAFEALVLLKSFSGV